MALGSVDGRVWGFQITSMPLFICLGWSISQIPSLASRTRNRPQITVRIPCLDLANSPRPTGLPPSPPGYALSQSLLCRSPVIEKQRKAFTTPDSRLQALQTPRVVKWGKIGSEADLPRSVLHPGTFTHPPDRAPRFSPDAPDLIPRIIHRTLSCIWFYAYRLP